MRPDGVVLLAPFFDHHLDLSQCVEYLSVEQLIFQLPIEALVIATLPGTTWAQCRESEHPYGPTTDE